MIEKERNAANVLLKMNAIQFLALDCQPHNATSQGKNFARSGIAITPKKRGFWGSLFG